MEALHAPASYTLPVVHAAKYAYTLAGPPRRIECGDTYQLDICILKFIYRSARFLCVDGPVLFYADSDPSEARRISWNASARHGSGLLGTMRSGQDA